MNHNSYEKCGCADRRQPWRVPQPPCGGVLQPKGNCGDTAWKSREGCCQGKGASFPKPTQNQSPCEAVPAGESLAMVYAPMQRFEELYDPRNGLCSGTIFTRLDKPFYGDRRNV